MTNSNNDVNDSIKSGEYWKDKDGNVWVKLVLERTSKVFHIEEDGMTPFNRAVYRIGVSDMTMPNGVKYKDLPVK